MKIFARLTAVLGIVSLLGSTAVFAQTPSAPPAATSTMSHSTMKSGKTTVKGYTKKLKNGKIVTVKGYNRTSSKMMPTPSKMTAVKGYTRTMKNGKKVTVKSYMRKAPAKKTTGSTM